MPQAVARARADSAPPGPAPSTALTALRFIPFRRGELVHMLPEQALLLLGSLVHLGLAREVGERWFALSGGQFATAAAS